MARLMKTLIKNLPSDFTKKIHDHQRNYSVTMLMYDDGSTKIIPCSGTLVQINKYKGILTARHVWNEAKEHDLLLLMVYHGNYAFETTLLQPFVPPTVGMLRKFNIPVPDIAFLKLPEGYSRDLEASGKVFLNIEKRVTNHIYPIDKRIGYWSIVGNPNEWLDIDNKKVSSFIYGTGPSNHFTQRGWDYLVMNLDLAGNPEIPKDFSGMSGGGIWQARWYFHKKKQEYIIEKCFNDIILSGISFFQTDLPDRKLIGHGPKSIYELLYHHVSTS